MRLILSGFCAEASNERSAHKEKKEAAKAESDKKTRSDELIEYSGIAEAHNL